MNGSRLVIFPICYSWNWNGFKKVPKKRKSEARAGKRTLKFQLPCKPQTSLCLNSLIATSLVGFSENTLHDYKINFQFSRSYSSRTNVTTVVISLQFSLFKSVISGKKYWKEVLNSFFTQGKKEFSGRCFWGQLYNSQLHSSILAKSDDRVFCIFETLQKLRINFIRFK